MPIGNKPDSEKSKSSLSYLPTIKHHFDTEHSLDFVLDSSQLIPIVVSIISSKSKVS